MFEIGRVCVKTAGREAGRYCVLVKRENDSTYVVTGPKVLTKVRRRKCNIDHLEPLEMTLKIKSDASDNDVLKAFSDEQLRQLNLKRPTAAEIKAWEAQKSEKERKREARERAEKEKKEREAKEKAGPEKKAAKKPEKTEAKKKAKTEEKK